MASMVRDGPSANADIALRFRSYEGIGIVNSLLHDMMFSYNDVTFDENTSTVSLHFDINPTLARDRVSRRILKKVGFAPPSAWILELNHVINMTMHDPDRLIMHSFNRMTMSDSHVLTLNTNEIGDIKFECEALDGIMYTP